MTNPYQASERYPYHISVSAVLLNNDGRIGCHYYAIYKGVGRKMPDNFYTLMHESVEMGEALETAVTRGLKEEFTATAKVEHYLGAYSFLSWKIDETRVEKTCLYFLCRLVELGATRDMADSETQSEIRWMDINELIKIFKAQGVRMNYPSADESMILERAKKYLYAKN